MKTFPEFTWEWIIQNCEMFRSWDQDALKRDLSSERHKSYLATLDGLLAIIPKLREHPYLEKLVPMKSMMSLRWFPSPTHEIQLYFDADKSAYIVSVYGKNGIETESVIEQKAVTFDDVADEIYAYITKYRDD